MAQPTTSPRQNTLRQSPERNEPRPRINRNGAAPISRSQQPSFNWGAAFDRWFTDQRSTLTLGVLLMGLAVGLLVAFVSYLMNGSFDQSVVGAAFSKPLAESGAETRNWVGLVGAYVAHVFVFRWFGVGALALPIIVFLAGYKMTFGQELLPLSRTTTALLFAAVWCSLITGYIVLVTNSAETSSVWCGGIGYEANSALYSLFGWGNLAFIGFLLFFFVIYFFDIRKLSLPSLPRSERPKMPKRSDDSLQTYEESEAEADDDTEPDSVDNSMVDGQVVKPEMANTFKSPDTNTSDTSATEPDVALPEVIAKTTGLTLTIKKSGRRSRHRY